MQEKEIKILFDAGTLKKAIIVPTPMGKGWCLQFEQKSKGSITMDAQRVSPRNFKTLDAAYRTVRDIGFRDASIAGD